MYLGKMLSIKKIRRIFIEIIREAVAVADKMQIKIEVFAGKLDFHKFLNSNSLFADFRRHLFLIILGFKYRKLKSSSLQSLERGKLTEIDYLNGYIVKNGKRSGIPVPVNTAVVDMIHDIEQKKRGITYDNFDNLVFERFNN
jgi:2-dehydropantoate 2-reductase